MYTSSDGVSGLAAECRRRVLAVVAEAGARRCMVYLHETCVQAGAAGMDLARIACGGACEQLRNANHAKARPILHP